MIRAFAACVLAGALAGCGGTHADIGTVNLAQVQKDWPKFGNYQRQLYADEAAIERSNVPEATKAHEREQLRARYESFQREIEGDLQAAAATVAANRSMRLIVTREFVGYGGVDVTADLEKTLNITKPK